MPATTVSTLNNELTTDSTTNEDLEDADMSTIEDEVASITTEATSMVTKTEITTTPIPTITYHKFKSQLTRNISQQQRIPNRYVTFVAIQVNMQEIVTKGDQRIEINKYHTKGHQKTSEATPV